MDKLAQDADYIQFMKELRPLLISRENGMMLEFSFWQTSPPMVTNGIFELRKYTLKVSPIQFFFYSFILMFVYVYIAWKIVRMGNELVKKRNIVHIKYKFTHIISYRRKGLECRRQFCEPVGAWFTQLGELNTVYHMWTYP